MRVAIMQPTYLPWLGYMDLMDQVDTFVLLDTVQFDYRSWQHRNRVRTESGLSWLTVPVSAKEKSKAISKIQLGESPEFPARHLNVLKHCYAGGNSSQLLQSLVDLLGEWAQNELLAAVTIPSIEFLRTHLGVTTTTLRASELDVTGHRSELLLNICRTLEANTYVSPPGSLDYLANDGAMFEDAGVEVRIQHYEHPEYHQRYEPFIPYASAVDALFNVDQKDVGELMRSGRRSTQTLTEAQGND